METKTPRKLSYTDVTWANLGNQGLTRESAPRGWMGQHDLAVEAYEKTRNFCPLSFDQWRILVDACAAGLPVYITAHGREAVYIIDQIMTLSPGTTANLYVRGWGFSFPLALGDIPAVRVPPTTYQTVALQLADAEPLGIERTPADADEQYVGLGDFDAGQEA